MFCKKLIMVLWVCMQCCTAYAGAFSIQEQNRIVAKIETFLEGITAMEAQFIEVNSATGIATGRFFIMRPNRMKVQYLSPHRNVILADGKNLYHWDNQLNEKSRYDITSSPIAAILSKRINLRKDAIVKSVKQDSERVWIRLGFRDYSGIESIVLIFTKNPFCLSQWIIIDNMKKTTEITLQNINRKANLSVQDFDFKSNKE